MKSPKLYHCHTRHWWKTSLSSLPGIWAPSETYVGAVTCKFTSAARGGLAALQHVLLGGR